MLQCNINSGRPIVVRNLGVIMFNIFNWFWRVSKEHSIYKRTLNELSSMSDRDLNDIGISRGDIPFIAAESARIK